MKSVEASIEHVRSIVSAKSTADKQKSNLNKIHVDGLKHSVMLLKTFEEVIEMIQQMIGQLFNVLYSSKLKLHLDRNPSETSCKQDLEILG